MKRNLLLVSLLFVSSIVFGQNYAFKVMANKGDNKIKSASGTQALKTGASLQDTDEIILSDNAYLGLVHSSGKTMELKQSGSHKVADLAKQVSTGNSSVASKYADFVLSKMSAEGKKNRLSATGAVHRGSNDAITVFMPSSVEVFQSEAIVRWDSLENNEAYYVSLSNMFGDELLKVETNSPSISIDMTDEKIAKENVVLLTVSSKDNESIKSSTHAIKKLPAAKAGEVQSTVNDLTAGVDQESALNKLILAGFYEENNLLVDALTSYEEAIKLAPGVESYQEAYTEFLLRNRLGE